MRGRDVKLIKQDTPHSCGLACIAMVLGTDMDGARKILGRTCEELHEELGDQPDPIIGVTWHEFMQILFERGVATTQYFDPKYYPEDHWLRLCYHKLRLPTIKTVREHLAAGGTAILGVPSLNIPDGSHWIVFHEREVFDPSPKKTYQTGDLLDIEQAVLIGQPAIEARQFTADRTGEMLFDDEPSELRWPERFSPEEVSQLCAK